MLTIIENGNALQSDAQWLVCPTNLMGVMGAGIAKVIRDCAPDLYKEYQKRCKDGTHDLLTPYVNEQYGVCCLATKSDWRDPTNETILSLAIKTLSEWLATLPADSRVALPLLGGGNGQYKVRNGKKIKASTVSRERIVELITQQLIVPETVEVLLYK